MGSRDRITNWDGTQSWRPEAVHHPSGEAEVAALVRRAADQRRRLKAVGSALSWSDIIDMPEQAMRLDRMARVLEVDPQARRVRVQGGAPLARVHEALAESRLAFDNFGSIVMQTAAGYTGSGSHGTGVRTPVLSSTLTGMRLVDGLGQVRVLDAEHEPKVFHAARVHLGCLGVVTELTFQCVDAFDLEERLELLPFDRVLGDLEALVARNEYCKLWWLPYTDLIQVYTFNRTTRPRTRLTAAEWLDTSGLSGRLFSGLIGLSRAVPAIIPRMHATIQRVQFRPHTRVDRSDRIIRYAGTIPVHQETEYAIPVAQAARAIDRVRSMVLGAKYRVNFPLEVRYCAADDIPMSPASGRPSCWLGAYIGSVVWAQGYFADFQALMREYGGRPHWGKTFDRSAAELRALYPGYEAFAALRGQCDPHGVFRNRFVDRVFALA